MSRRKRTSGPIGGASAQPSGASSSDESTRRLSPWRGYLEGLKQGLKKKGDSASITVDTTAEKKSQGNRPRNPFARKLDGLVSDHLLKREIDAVGANEASTGPSIKDLDGSIYQPSVSCDETGEVFEVTLTRLK